MPLVNEDGTLDEEYLGFWHRCDLCGKVEQLYNPASGVFTLAGNKEHEFRREVSTLFAYVRKWDIPGCLCGDCIDKCRPFLGKLRDVIELDIAVNRLKKAINERRKTTNKNHGTAAVDAC